LLIACRRRRLPSLPRATSDVAAAGFFRHLASAATSHDAMFDPLILIFISPTPPRHDATLATFSPLIFRHFRRRLRRQIASHAIFAATDFRFSIFFHASAARRY